MLLVVGARPAQAIVFDGKPDVHLTASLIDDGGGPFNFSSATMFRNLAGPLAEPEQARLQQRFGATQVATYFDMLQFFFTDAMHVTGARDAAFPTPSFDASQQPQMVRALYVAGRSKSGKWDVGYMLERLVSHDTHRIVMGDLDSKFGAANNTQFHIFLTQLIGDLYRG